MTSWWSWLLRSTSDILLQKPNTLLLLKYLEGRLISNLHNQNLLLPLSILTSLPNRPVNCKRKNLVVLVVFCSQRRMTYNKQLVPGSWKQDWTLFCCQHCSGLLTIFNNTVEPKSGATIQRKISIRMSRLCSATFEQLLAFIPTFYNSGNFKQLLI